MTDVTSTAHRSEVVQTRRGYTLLGLGLLLPGSAQVLQGSKPVGRFAIKLWLTLVGLAVVAVVLTLLFRNAMIGVFASAWVLRVAAVAVFVIGGFWSLLAINTWWVARPRRMGAKKGVIFSAIALVLAVALVGGTVWVGRAAWATAGALGSVIVGGGDTHQKNGRYNILLLGSDAGPDRWGIRPDSINVVSINADTGRAIIFGLPRNLEYIPFPDTSPLHALYPDGFGCESEECLLNAIYLLGQEHADLYPGVDDPGIQAMLEGVSGATGLSLNYYAMIDMQGFIDLIDAMGGLTMTINSRVALNPDDNVYLEAGENQHLTGYETLWFARARVTTSDFDRMQRQRCVMAAMLHQLNPTLVATKFTELAAATATAAKTSVPASQIGALTALALKARALPIMSVSFTPPLIHSGDPDYALMRQIVADTIAQSEALDNPGTATQPPPATSAPTGGTDPGTAEPTDAPTDNVRDNLNQVCSVG